MANWRKNSMVGALAVIIIIIAVSFTVKRMMPKKYYYTSNLKCEACNDIFQQKLYGGQRFPVKCQKCGKQAAYRALKCMTCGEVFLSKPIEMPELKKGEEPTPEMMEMLMDMPKCPKCGSFDIGSVNEPERPSAGAGR